LFLGAGVNLDCPRARRWKAPHPSQWNLACRQNVGTRTTIITPVSVSARGRIALLVGRSDRWCSKCAAPGQILLKKRRVGLDAFVIVPFGVGRLCGVRAAITPRGLVETGRASKAYLQSKIDGKIYDHRRLQPISDRRAAGGLATGEILVFPQLKTLSRSRALQD